MSLTLKHLRKAERQLLKADMGMKFAMRDDGLCASLHTAMMFLELAIQRALELNRAH